MADRDMTGLTRRSEYEMQVQHTPAILADTWTSQKLENGGHKFSLR